jgi:hypothetical protein
MGQTLAHLGLHQLAVVLVAVNLAATVALAAARCLSNHLAALLARGLLVKVLLVGMVLME